MKQSPTKRCTATRQAARVNVNVVGKFNMNTAQKLILIIAAIISVYMLLTAPKYYYRYNPQSRGYYEETPFPGAKEEINYSKLLPKLLSLIIISGTLIAIFSKTTIRKLTRAESYLLILSCFIIVGLTYSHFKPFLNNGLYLLAPYYYSFVASIGAIWLIYFSICKKLFKRIDN